MKLLVDESPSAGEFQQWHALLHAAAGDSEEVLAICFCEAAVAFGDIGSDGDSGAVELIAEKEVAARESLRQRGDVVREIDGLLLDSEFLEEERHGQSFTRVERRKETAGENRPRTTRPWP